MKYPNSLLTNTLMLQPPDCAHSPNHLSIVSQICYHLCNPPWWSLISTTSKCRLGCFQSQSLHSLTKVLLYVRNVIISTDHRIPSLTDFFSFLAINLFVESWPLTQPLNSPTYKISAWTNIHLHCKALSGHFK